MKTLINNLKTAKYLLFKICRWTGEILEGLISLMFVQSPADRQIEAMRDYARVYLHAM